MARAIKMCARHFSVARPIFLDPGLFVSPRPSGCDVVFYSERRSVDLGALYLNISVLQTISNQGTVVFCFDNPEFDNPE